MTCEPFVLKEYKINGAGGEVSFFVFPEDFRVSLQGKYSRLNSYGIYPYYNVRSHNVTVRYGTKEMISTLKEIVDQSLNDATPVTITCPTDPIASSMSGFINLPIEFSGLFGEDVLQDGFSFNITEAPDHFKTVTVGTEVFKIPPDSYSYIEQGSGSNLIYSSGTDVIYKPGIVQKGFTINLPTAYSTTLEALKAYRYSGLADGGVDVTDEVGNSFTGKGYLTSLSYGGSVIKATSDSNSGDFLPSGLSFSVLSLDFCVAS